MPRDGSGAYSAPAGTKGSPNTTIESSKYNAFVADIVTDLNAARPISSGGTGATSASGARTNLGVPASADLKWLSKAIGELYAVDDSMTGADTPPTDNAGYRYIKLTASDAYNTGVLTSESVTGSAPLVVATAVIDDEDSPLDGETVNLINTERRFLRAGSAGSVQADAMQQITGEGGITRGSSLGGAASWSGQAISGAISDGGSEALLAAGPVQTNKLSFDSANSPGARTANETRSKNVGVNYYMRIR